MLHKYFSELNNKNIRYSHWKSNIRLAKSFRGKTDFDLLFDIDSKKEVEEINYKYGFIRVKSPKEKSYSHIEDYLAFDSKSGDIFHFHIHYRLVTGRSEIKNYNLPFENIILESSSEHKKYPVKTPSFEIEFIILLIRVILKTEFGPKEILKGLLGFNILPKVIEREILELKTLVNFEKLQLILKEDFSLRIYPIFESFLKDFEDGSITRFKMLKLHILLANKLSKFKRYNSLIARIIMYKNRFTFFYKLKTGNSKKIFFNSNLSLGLLGVDGSGKSTSVKILKSWFSWKLNSKTFYMGKQNTPIMRLFSFFRPRAIINSLRGKSQNSHSFFEKIDDILLSFRLLELARKKYSIYRAAMHQRNRGQIIIFDRYPTNVFASATATMDGPKILGAIRNKTSFILAMSALETRMLNKITLPDITLLLNVSLENSLSRKPEHAGKENIIKDKIDSLRTITSSTAFEIKSIDSNRPRDEVILEIKKNVWSYLRKTA